MTNIPLYRYRPFGNKDDQDKVQEIVQDSCLYFTSPNSFNDPFDCKPVVSIAGGTAAQLRELFTQGLRNSYPSFSVSKITDLVEQLMEPSNLAKIEENAGDLLYVLLCKDAGVCCFTRKNDDILMFSHYADNHRGLCLEFQLPSFEHVREVKYGTDRPLINWFNRTKQETADKMFFWKSQQWAYECEYRVLSDNPGRVNFSESFLRGIIFGCKMPKEHKDMVRSWLKDRKTPVNLYEAHTKKNEYGIYITPFANV